MQYRSDQKSGNELSVLGFGCMRLPSGIGGIDMKKTEQMILKAIKQGVNYFDTAYIYPGSEVALGKVLADNNLREDVYVATKLPISSCTKTEDFDRIFIKQLDSLKTDYIDYYLMHNINSMKQWMELCELGIENWIKEKKEKGQIRRIGFSFHGSGNEFMKLLDAYDWEFCQIQYNYSDENYQAGKAGLHKANEKGLPVIVMEPLLGGKLATGLPSKAESVFKKVNPDLSIASWGFRWLLDQPEVTVILSGMNSDEQVADNLKTVADSHPGMLTDTEKEAYEQVIEIFRESYKVPCTGCGYCLPCPQNVNIPGCFASYNSSYSMGRVVGFMQYINSTAAINKNNQLASNCIGCGKCENHCPQHIEIRKSLKDTEKRMEPFYFRIAVSLINIFQKRAVKEA